MLVLRIEPELLKPIDVGSQCLVNHSKLLLIHVHYSSFLLERSTRSVLVVLLDLVACSRSAANI